jgi:hypothetical protein
VTDYCKLLHVIWDYWLERPYFGKGNYRKLRDKKSLICEYGINDRKKQYFGKGKNCYL